MLVSKLLILDFNRLKFHWKGVGRRATTHFLTRAISDVKFPMSSNKLELGHKIFVLKFARDFQSQKMEIRAVIFQLSCKLFSNRIELLRHPEDIKDKEAQIATWSQKISLLLKTIIFVFQFHSYLVIANFMFKMCL